MPKTETVRELPPNCEWVEFDGYENKFELIFIDGEFALRCVFPSGIVFIHSPRIIGLVGAGLWRCEVARLEPIYRELCLVKHHVGRSEKYMIKHEKERKLFTDKIKAANAQVKLWEAPADKTIGGG